MIASCRGTTAVCLLFFLSLFGEGSVKADFDIDDLIGNTEDSEKTWHKLFELEDCPIPQALDSTIIRVNESLSSGAAFIGAPEDVTNRYKCEFECCQAKDEGCNVAVYSSEAKTCYLFNCGNPSKCRFDGHADYTSSLINAAQSAQQETTVVPDTTARTTTTAATTAAAPAKELHLLDGCRPDVDNCVDSLSYCAPIGFCMCEKNHHPKNGVCRKDCHDELEFECMNAEKRYATPDCVAIYDVCDGTPQCSDGSDEKNCDKVSKGDLVQNLIDKVPSMSKEEKGNSPGEQSHRSLEILHKQNDIMDDDASPFYQQPGAKPNRPLNLGAQANRIASDKTGGVNDNHQRKNGRYLAQATPAPRSFSRYDSLYNQRYSPWTKGYQAPSRPSYKAPYSQYDYDDYDTYNPYDSDYQRYLEQYKRPGKIPQQSSLKQIKSDDNAKDTPYSRMDADEVPAKLAVPEKAVPTKADETSEPIKAPITTSAPVIDKKLVDELVNEGNSTGSRVNEEVILEPEEGDGTGTSNAAIIALSLSLSMTFCLLVYLGCRYKNMKTRLTRRGHKRLKGDEADYLIDGMYL